MGSLLGGKPKTTTSTSTVDLPGWIEGPLQDLMSRANTLSNQAYTPYEGERVAGFTGDELTAQQGIRDIQGAGSGNYDYANELLNLVARTGTDGFSQDYLDQYMNPYQTNVLDVAKNRALDTYSQQKNAYGSRAGQIGSFGGSRTALGEAQMAEDFQRQLQENETLGLANNYNQAQGAAERGMGRVATAASGIAGLADAQQGYNLRDIQALSGSGQQQRLQNQLGLDTTYENYLQEKQYPYQQLEFLANIGMPLGQLNAGQTNTQTQSGGGGGILSKALGVASMFAAPFTGGASLMGGLGSLGGSLAGMFGPQLSQGAIGMASAGNLFGMAEGGMVPFAEGGSTGKPSFEQILMALKQAQEAADGAPIGVQSGDTVYTEDPSYNFQPYDVLDNREKQVKMGMPTGAGLGAMQQGISEGTQRLPYDQDSEGIEKLLTQPASARQGTLSLSSVQPNFDDVVTKATSEYGDPAEESAIRKMMFLESSGDVNAKNGSYSGLFQIGDAAAADVGIEDYSDPYNNAVAGVKYWNLNKERLNSKLGRAPKSYELYLAHQQGANGAHKIISNPEELAVKTVGKGEVLANGGDATMTNKEFLNLWKDKFSKAPVIGVKQDDYAQGDEVKHYADGGSVYFGDSGLTPFQRDVQGGVSRLADYAVDSGQKGVNDVLDFLSYFTENDKQKFTRQQDRNKVNTGVDLLQAENRLRSPSGLESMMRNPLPLYKGQIPQQTPAREVAPIQSPIALENDLYLQDMGVEPPTSETKPSPVEDIKSKFADQLVSKGTEAKPDKFNYPLFAFGAALLANDSDFFSDLGVAGTAGVNTHRAMKEQEKAEKASAEANRQKQILEMFKLGQEDRGLDIRQQNADTLAKSSAPSPYKNSIENLRMQLLQKRLAEGPKDDKFRQQLILQAMQSYTDNPVESADAIMRLMGGDVGEDPLAASAAEMGLTLE